MAWLDLRFVQAYQALRQQVGDAGQSDIRQEAIDFQASVLAICRLPRAGLVPLPARRAGEACVAQAYQQQRNLWAARLKAVFQDESNRPLVRHIELQAFLQQLGYIPPTARVDGVYGPTTRAAIAAWQITHNLPSTGALSSFEVALLDQDVNGTLAPSQAAARVVSPPEFPQQSTMPVNNELATKADEERRLAITRAEAEKAKAQAEKARAEAEKAQAETERARAEADVLASKERAEAELRRKVAEQARMEREAHGIQP